MAGSVLIVEDQVLIAWHLSDLVEGAGHRVLAIARDPAEAMEAAARMLFECWGVRSIYISANLDPTTRAQGEQLQALGFVGKPFLPAEVIAAVQRAVRALSG
jgi:CheY-like chemotaxis protein